MLREVGVKETAKAVERSIRTSSTQLKLGVNQNGVLYNRRAADGPREKCFDEKGRWWRLMIDDGWRDENDGLNGTRDFNVVVVVLHDG